MTSLVIFLVGIAIVVFNAEITPSNGLWDFNHSRVQFISNIIGLILTVSGGIVGGTGLWRRQFKDLATFLIGISIVGWSVGIAPHLGLWNVNPSHPLFWLKAIGLLFTVLGGAVGGVRLWRRQMKDVATFLIGTSLVVFSIWIVPHLGPEHVNPSHPLFWSTTSGMLLTVFGGFVGGMRLWRRGAQEKSQERLWWMMAVSTWIVTIAVVCGLLFPAIRIRKQQKTIEARTAVRKLYDWQLTQFDSAKTAGNFEVAEFRFRSLGSSLKEVPKGTCVPYSELEPQWKPILDLIKNAEGCFRYQYRVYGCPGAPECKEGQIASFNMLEDHFSYFGVEAHGDLDGDGVHSYFLRANGVYKVTGEIPSGGIYTERELE